MEAQHEHEHEHEPASYARRLERRADGQPLVPCVGIDPSPEALERLGPPTTGPVAGGARRSRAAQAERLGGFLVEAARDDAVAVKPQLAWFEQAGAPGLRALERVVRYARAADLLVVLDAKRGDVPHSMAAYAEAWLGEQASSGIGGDALTIHGSLGPDTIDAALAVARERGCQAYVLVHTSNPRAGVLQGLPSRAAHGIEGPWWEHLARVVAAAGAGAVVGATHPQVLERARELLPAAPLLVPGVGAQGGSIAQLAALVAPGAPPALVSSSRGLLPPDTRDPAGLREHVRGAVRELSEALASAAADAATRVPAP